MKTPEELGHNPEYLRLKEGRRLHEMNLKRVGFHPIADRDSF